MPPTLTLSNAIIIGKNESPSDNFLRFTILSDVEPLIYGLYRMSSKKTKTTPDLFDSAELLIEASHPNSFIREYTLNHRLDGIPKNYTTFSLASKWLKLLTQNHHLCEPGTGIYALTQKALNAWNTHKAPHSTYLKSLYLLAKQEGLPVQKDWLSQLPGNDQNKIKTILTTPLDELNQDDDNVKGIPDSLIAWLKHSTYITA